MTELAPGPTARQPAAARSGVEERHMRVALEAARRAGLAGEPPIGACIVRDGAVIATAANCVVSSLDVTAHAEVAAIREACRRERSLDLSGCELYVTVEPCPMCRAASHYAGIGRIVCGATLEDFDALTGEELVDRAGAGPVVEPGCLREESLVLLRAWAERRPA